MTRDEARAFVEALVAMRDIATDAQASTVPSIYPSLKVDGNLIPAGTRINWYGVIRRAAVDLWDNPDTNPDNAPELWEKLDYREGHRIIPDTITVGTAFALGELGWWGNVLYKSMLDNNVYTPEAYPAGWEIS